MRAQAVLTAPAAASVLTARTSLQVLALLTALAAVGARAARSVPKAEVPPATPAPMPGATADSERQTTSFRTGGLISPARTRGPLARLGHEGICERGLAPAVA